MKINKTVEELAYEFSQQFIDPTDENSSYEAQASLIGFIAGFSAQKRIEQKILRDTLNKYKSNLADATHVKLTKIINEDRVMILKAKIEILEEIKNKL